MGSQSLKSLDAPSLYSYVDKLVLQQNSSFEEDQLEKQEPMQPIGIEKKLSFIRSPTLISKGLEMNKIDKIVLAAQKLTKPHQNGIEILLHFIEETMQSLAVEEMTIFGISPWFSEVYLAPFRKSKGNNIKDVLLDGRWI